MHGKQWLVLEDACCHAVPSGPLRYAEWPLSVHDLAGTQSLFPPGQFCHHMFKPLPQMWQERLGPTRPVFTLNVYSMLKSPMCRQGWLHKAAGTMLLCTEKM